jgi:hypothetical protein
MLTSVIPACCEAEIRKISGQGHPGQKDSEDPSQPKII